jgi:hypothetical protein
MAVNLNSESLTNLLCNPKGGAIAVVLYASSYSPSVEFVARMKSVAHDFPSIQLIIINTDDHKHLLGLPVINVSEIPALILFNHGRPVSQPIVDSFHAGARLRRLGLQSMETDDFEAVGTLFNVAPGTDLSKWKKKSGHSVSRTDSVIATAAAPLLTVMDSIYEL